MAITVLPPAVLLHRRRIELARLRRAATTDVTTGLLNAYGWRQRADATAALTRRHPTGFGVLMIDLDHFKSINEAFGHLAGTPYWPR